MFFKGILFNARNSIKKYLNEIIMAFRTVRNLFVSFSLKLKIIFKKDYKESINEIFLLLCVYLILKSSYFKEYGFNNIIKWQYKLSIAEEFQFRKIKYVIHMFPE